MVYSGVFSEDLSTKLTTGQESNKEIEAADIEELEDIVSTNLNDLKKSVENSQAFFDTYDLEKDYQKIKNSFYKARNVNLRPDNRENVGAFSKGEFIQGIKNLNIQVDGVVSSSIEDPYQAVKYLLKYLGYNGVDGKALDLGNNSRQGKVDEGKDLFMALVKFQNKNIKNPELEQSAYKEEEGGETEAKADGIIGGYTLKGLLEDAKNKINTGNKRIEEEKLETERAEQEKINKEIIVTQILEDINNKYTEEQIKEVYEGVETEEDKTKENIVKILAGDVEQIIEETEELEEKKERFKLYNRDNEIRFIVSTKDADKYNYVSEESLFEVRESTFEDMNSLELNPDQKNMIKGLDNLFPYNQISDEEKERITALFGINLSQADKLNKDLKGKPFKLKEKKVLRESENRLSYLLGNISVLSLLDPDNLELEPEGLSVEKNTGDMISFLETIMSTYNGEKDKNEQKSIGFPLTLSDGTVVPLEIGLDFSRKSYFRGSLSLEGGSIIDRTSNTITSKLYNGDNIIELVDTPDRDEKIKIKVIDKTKENISGRGDEMNFIKEDLANTEGFQSATKGLEDLFPYDETSPEIRSKLMNLFFPLIEKGKIKRIDRKYMETFGDKLRVLSKMYNLSDELENINTNAEKLTNIPALISLIQNDFMEGDVLPTTIDYSKDGEVIKIPIIIDIDGGVRIQGVKAEKIDGQMVSKTMIDGHFVIFTDAKSIEGMNLTID